MPIKTVLFYSICGATSQLTVYVSDMTCSKLTCLTNDGQVTYEFQDEK